MSEQTRLAYSPEEAAGLLGLSRSTIYRMVENGTLPYKRVKANGKGQRERIIIPAVGLSRWLSCTDEPRQVVMNRKAREIAKSAVAKLRKA